MYKNTMIAIGLLVLWSLALSVAVKTHTSDITGLNRSIVDIKMQYAGYDAKLTDLILKQDQRITLLEDLMGRDNANR